MAVQQANLTNSIFLRDNSISNFGSHLDSQHLRHLLKDIGPDDMGIIDLWALKQKVEAPMITMASFSGKGTHTITDTQGRYKFSLPVAQDLPYLLDDPNPGNTTKGADGLPFQIKVNKRSFGPGEIICYDKYTGKQMVVDPTVPIVSNADGVIYTVKMLSNSATDFVPNSSLAPNTKLHSGGSVMGEYGEVYNDLGSVSGGSREYYNFVGQAWESQSLSFSSQADMITKGWMNANGTIPVTEIWKCYDPGLDPSIANIDGLVKTMGKEWTKKAKENGTLTKSFVTSMESACIAKIARGIEYQIMWGTGGKVQLQDGAADARMPVGLWRQMDNNYKRIYNKSNFTLDLFKSEIFNFFNGKVDFSGPESGRLLTVQTGMGGLKLVSEAIQNAAVNAGFVINAKDVGAIQGTGMNLSFGYAFDAIRIPFLATLTFKLNPAFDNLNTSSLENPVIDGFNLSSYNFIIFDVTDTAADNIVMLQNPDYQLKWFYENGDTDYLGQNGHQGSGKFSGYRVNMKQRHKALWVKDSTKVLKLVMKNPITGGSF